MNATEWKKEYSRQYYIDNKDKIRKSMKKYQDNNKARQKIYKKNYSLKRDHKITLDEYNDLLLDQDNKCAICKSAVTYFLNVDHDHETDQIRGLLCNSCNLVLGHIKDDISILKNMIKYLSK